VDTNLLVQLVEDVTETKTLIKQALGNQEDITKRFDIIERRIGTVEDTIKEATMSWKTAKMIFSTIIAILGGILTLNWSSVAHNWDTLFK